MQGSSLRVGCVVGCCLGRLHRGVVGEGRRSLLEPCFGVWFQGSGVRGSSLNGRIQTLACWYIAPWGFGFWMPDSGFRDSVVMFQRRGDPLSGHVLHSRLTAAISYMLVLCLR